MPVPSLETEADPGPGHPLGRVLVVGATGDIGRATVEALLRGGRAVVCIVRARHAAGAKAAAPPLPDGVEIRVGDVSDPAFLAGDGLGGERFDAVVSCLASRTGAPDDAWAIDHRANLNVLEAARIAGVGHFVLVSAICVQKPRLAFQFAKLAFEDVLRSSGVRYSIVRPTAFFKSLSGQIDRVRRGKPFLVFGDGVLTACKPIGDADLADFIVGCLDDESRWNRTLPIGGPGLAITPRDQGQHLFDLLGQPARFTTVPLAVLDAAIWALSLLGRVAPGFAAKAEFARIGRYYATESMLVLDPTSGRYDAAATPSTGAQTLLEFYADVLAGASDARLGDHAFFDRGLEREAITRSPEARSRRPGRSGRPGSVDARR